MPFSCKTDGTCDMTEMLFYSVMFSSRMVSSVQTDYGRTMGQQLNLQMWKHVAAAQLICTRTAFAYVSVVA